MGSGGGESPSEAALNRELLEQQKLQKAQLAAETRKLQQTRGQVIKSMFTSSGGPLAGVKANGTIPGTNGGSALPGLVGKEPPSLLG